MLQSVLCTVCGSEPKKYKCPGCRAGYCSLACYKSHKEVCQSQQAGCEAVGLQDNLCGFVKLMWRGACCAWVLFRALRRQAVLRSSRHVAAARQTSRLTAVCTQMPWPGVKCSGVISPPMRYRSSYLGWHSIVSYPCWQREK